MKETYIRDTLCNGGIIDGKKKYYLIWQVFLQSFLSFRFCSIQVAGEEVTFETNSKALYMVDLNTQEVVYQKKRFTAVGARFLYQNYDVYCCCGIHI